MMQSLAKKQNCFSPQLPKLLIALFCVQPVLDMMTYWQDTLSLDYSLSFLPRLLILALLAIGGFLLSERKRIYVAVFSVLAVFYAAHLFVCYQQGSINLVNDAKNFIRVLQLPVTALAMITCLRVGGDDVLDAIERGVFFSLLILAASFAVSTLTGTEPHTYPDEKVGLRGYCFWPNAQSAILSLSAPIAIACAIRRWKDKPLICIGTMVLSLGMLYLHGTRLAYFCMAVCGVGMTIVLFATGQPKKYALILAALTVAFLALFPFSAMRTNRVESAATISAVKKDASSSLLTLGRRQVQNGSSSLLYQRGIVQPATGMEAFALRVMPKKTLYTDISADDPDNAALAYCEELNLIHSTNKTYAYLPEDYISIAQTVTCAVEVYERYRGLRDFNEYVPFAWGDVDLDKAKAYGLTVGNIDDYVRTIPEERRCGYVFGIKMDSPDAYETALFRATAVELLYRALSPEAFPKTCDMQVPQDVSPNLPQYEAICALYAAGVMTDPAWQEEFQPLEYITRRDFAKLLAAVLSPDFRLCDEGYTKPRYTRENVEQTAISAEDRLAAQMHPLYDYFLHDLVQTFGMERTLHIYNNTTSASVIADEREWKLNFCELRMEESSFLSRLFGLEVDKLNVGDTSYNPENDFSSIYYLYGWIGLGLTLLFIGYFLLRIVLALLRDFKKTFTLQAGAMGVALVAPLLHSYFTCGVLQRPNALFYFGAMLAAVYYMTVPKKAEA